MKMKYFKKVSSVLLSLALLGMFLVGCGGDTPAAEGDDTTPDNSSSGTAAVGSPKEIVLGHVYSESHDMNKACIEFKEYVEEQSGGSITVNIQANSVLGGDEDMIEMCAIGTVTMMVPSTATLEMYSSQWSICSLPYLYNNVQDMYAALDGDLGDFLKDTLSDTEYICLGFNSNGTRNMSNNVRPITKVEDLKGIKMRVMNSPTYVTWMNALGANATPMGFNEVFTGLQQGTVDGQENSPSMTYEAKFQEVQKYYSITEHVFDMNAIICNRDFYEGLNDEEKAIIDYAMEEFMVKHQRQMDLDANDHYIGLIEDSGTEINYLDDSAKDGFREALQGVYADSRANLGDAIWGLVEKYQ